MVIGVGTGTGNECVSGGDSGSIDTYSFGYYSGQPEELLSTYNGIVSSTSLKGISLSTNGSIVETKKYLNPIISSQSNLSGANGGDSYYVYNSLNIYPSNLGGKGGAGLIIISKNFTFNGAVNLSGGNGTDAVFNASNGGGSSNTAYSASGGGGAGSVIINAQNLISNTGEFHLNGGTGGLGLGIQYGDMIFSDANDGGNGFVIWLNQ